MTTTTALKLTVLLVLSVVGQLAQPSSARTQSPAGLWEATVEVKVQGGRSLDVPFRFEIKCGEASCAEPGGSFFNGDDKVTATSGRFANGALVLSFDEYGTRLEAALKDGRLDGSYDRGTRGAPYPFHARRFVPIQTGGRVIPAIAGYWNVQVKSSKGESAWQLIVRQSAAEASAAILRIDGDTGTLTGSYRDGRFVLSHFSGARPLRLELTPRADGTLTLVQNADAPLTAVRADQALAKGLPQPSDPSRFTSVVDPTEPLRFSFPDLDGHTVSNTDERFRRKVVIVNISGSWCPNCHDETPFLVELYKQYHGRGLEIVSLSFEEQAQLKNPVRLRAFVKHYGVTYTVLLPGEPQELNDKLPQGVNLNSFPTTFILGRDGTVRGAHAGFPGKASGKFHDEVKAETTATVERLLAENAPAVQRR